MNARIYIEGGGDSKELRSRCREAFRRLLEKSGFAGRMPRLVACGGREQAFDDFCIAHATATNGNYVGLLVDSEDPLADVERTWDHLKQREGWEKPAHADDEQVLLMTTCMETWLATDRCALREQYPTCLQEGALPPVHNMEMRSRGSLQNALVMATQTCKISYAKGRQSFEVLGKLDPAELRKHLPSFARCERVLGVNL